MARGYALGFASLSDERTEALTVEGELPGWLDGSLVRNGPALFDAGGRSVDHWFDGLAMLRKFAVADGGVRYANRFLRTDAYRDARAGSLPAGFATGGGALSRLRALVAGPPDNANVNVARMGGRHVALTEAPVAVAFDPRTLSTRGRVEFAGDPPGHLVSAHPVHDPARGETVGFDARFAPRAEYRVYRVPDGTPRREVVGRVPVDAPAYVHSFGLTARFAVVAEPPFAASLRSLLRPGGGSFVDRFEWSPGRGTRFLLVDRRTGDLAAEARTDAFFVFHVAGAFERGGEAVVDLVAFPDPGAVGDLSLSRLRAGDVGSLGGELRRYRLDPAAGAVVDVSRLHTGGFALPRTAVRRGSHRYVYGQGNQSGSGPVAENRLRRVDCETGETLEWHEAGWYLSEPVVVPRPGGTEEDDGVVLAVALDAGAERSVLVALDAATLSEFARAPLPHALPFDFHGRFFEGVH